jgi:hypothetical protein
MLKKDDAGFLPGVGEIVDPVMQRGFCFSPEKRHGAPLIDVGIGRM